MSSEMHKSMIAERERYIREHSSPYLQLSIARRSSNGQGLVERTRSPASEAWCGFLSRDRVSKSVLQQGANDFC